jgi:hypothetical protein
MAAARLSLSNLNERSVSRQQPVRRGPICDFERSLQMNAPSLNANAETLRFGHGDTRRRLTDLEGAA